MKNAQQYLLSFGIRPSVQRLAIMEYLLTHKTHPTADEIFEAIHPFIPTLSKMTVYNTLNMLSGVGAILALDIDERNRRFDGDNSFHAHFMCRDCGKIEDIFIENDTPFASLVPGGEVDDMQLLLKGRCKKCSKPARNAKARSKAV